MCYSKGIRWYLVNCVLLFKKCIRTKMPLLIEFPEFAKYNTKNDLCCVYAVERISEHICNVVIFHAHNPVSSRDNFVVVMKQI